MKSIPGIAYRFFAKNKFVAATSIMSVAIAVTLILTMMLFVFSARQSLHNQVVQTYGDMDLSVGYNANQQKTIQEELLKYIANNPEIASSSNVLITKVKVNGLNSSELYTVGVENDFLAKSRYHFTKDISTSGVVLNARLAQALNVNKSDQLNVDGKEYTVDEVIKDYDAAGVTPDIVIMPRAAVMAIVKGKTGEAAEATYVLIKVKKDTDTAKVAKQFHNRFADLRVDVAKEDASVKSNLNATNRFLIVLSILLLVVTSILIIANFDVFLYKYKNQFAILRTLGATSKQLFKIAIIQCSLINAIGTVLGLVFSSICHTAMQKWLNGLFLHANADGRYHFSYSIVLTMLCFIFVELFMLVPSYRIARMLPLRIWRENEKLDFSKRKSRKRAGKVMFFTGVILIALVLVGNLLGENSGVAIILISSILLMGGMALLMPVYVSSIFTFLLPAIKYVFGKTSYVAVKNVIPQVRKNTFIMMSITILLILSIFGSATIQTLANNQERYVRQQYATDILATSRAGYESIVDHNELNQAVKSIPGVDRVFAISTVFEAELGSDRSGLRFDYILGDLAEMSRAGLLPSFKEQPKNSIILTRKFAENHHIKEGDLLAVGVDTMEAGGSHSDNVVVAGLVKEIPGTFVPAVLDWSNENYNNKYTRFNRAFITSKNSEETLKSLNDLTDEFPEIQFNSLERSIKESNEIYNQRWSIFKVFLYVIMICVTFGVFETLVTNIYSKRKELAILRTMNIGSNGVRRVILTQVTLYLLFGIVFGTVTGISLTLVMNLVDANAGAAAFDFTNLVEIIGFMFFVMICIFVPFANRLMKTKISNELHLDNK